MGGDLLRAARDHHYSYEPTKNLGADLVAAFGEAEVAQAAAEAKDKEEADLLELEAADAAAQSQGMGV